MRSVVLAALALGCSGSPGDVTSYPDPPPVRTAQQASGSAQDADSGVPPSKPPPAAPKPAPFVPTRNNTRWWENRDAGSCVSSIPVYGVGDCDCDKGQVCGDGCGISGNVEVFCVCGGLREEKRAASWEIRGWDQRYAGSCADAGR